MTAAEDAAEEQAGREVLRLFDVVELSPDIAQAAVELRKERRLRLPDAIVLATAFQHGCALVTRNTRDFDEHWPEVRVPYRL